MPSTPPLIIPVENQVRELDAKLLLACIAVRRGFSSIIGSHREVDFQVASFPCGLYLNKSMTERNLNMFQILHRLGHAILTWDEEALVHLPPAIYYSRRLSPAAISYVSHLFAWGENNAELWRHYPHLPQNLPIHVTGNPRNDMLRPELRSFYEDEVQRIRDRYGDYLLINTNFNHVNAFFPAQNLFKPAKYSRKRPRFGKAGVGMPLAYAEGLRSHKQAIFEAFQKLIVDLTHAFPHLSVVVRPHPTECQEIYGRIAQKHHRIHVTNDGNVVPWLLAARALVHNGCTTGVEAHVMQVPAISYRPVVNENYDSGFYFLPNRLSHQAFDRNQLVQMIADVLVGRLSGVKDSESDAIARRYLAALGGPLACERIADILEKTAAGYSPRRKARRINQMMGMALSKGRKVVNHFRTIFSKSFAPPQFHRHRYPGISLKQLRLKVSRFQIILGHTNPIHVEQVSTQIFKITNQ